MSKLGKGFAIKDGKVVKISRARDVSAKIRERKSKKQRVVRKITP